MAKKLSYDAPARHMTTIACKPCGRDFTFATRFFDTTFDLLMRCGWICREGEGYQCPACNGVSINEATELIARIESTEREALRKEIQKLFGEHAIGHNMIAVNAGAVLLLIRRADERDTLAENAKLEEAKG